VFLFAPAENPKPYSIYPNPRTTPLNAADFLTEIETALQPRHLPFSRAALQAFVNACWPWMEDDPGLELWAAKFLATDDLMVPA
jgi:hypothetical protein